MVYFVSKVIFIFPKLSLVFVLKFRLNKIIFIPGLNTSK